METKTMDNIAELVVEHNVPIPPAKRDGTYIKILRQLQVGDSFVAKKNKAVTLHFRAKKLNIKLSIRKINDAQCRIWRIK